MITDTYIKLAMRTESENFTAIIERLQNRRIIRIFHSLLGMQTEIGELVDVFKKHIFYGKEIDYVNVKEEIGDLFWYLALFFDAMGLDPIQIMQQNIEKLRKRYPERFTCHDAINRNIENEMTAFWEKDEKDRMKYDDKEIELLRKVSAAADKMTDLSDVADEHFSIVLDSIKLAGGEDSTAYDLAKSLRELQNYIKSRK